MLEELPDVVLAYGQSDEFSFVVRKLSQLYERRARCERSAHAHTLAISCTLSALILMPSSSSRHARTRAAS